MVKISLALIFSHLTFLLTINPVIGDTNNTLKSSRSLNSAREWVKAFIEDLEFASNLENVNDPLHKEQKEDLIDALMNKITRKGYPFINYFAKNIQIFSKTKPQLIGISFNPHVSTSRPPLGFEDVCDPANHIQIDTKGSEVDPFLFILDRNNPEDAFFNSVNTWQDLYLNDDMIQICNVHLGLICDLESKKCTCRPDNEWVTSQSKCYLNPEAQCTFRQLKDTYEEIVHDIAYLRWFTRMFIHPMTHPICGIGTVCETFDKVTPPICYCIDKDNRLGCKNKQTFQELEPVEHKLEKLFVEISQSCVQLPFSIQKLIDDTTKPGANLNEIYEKLVQNNVPLCRFPRKEFCDRNYINGKFEGYRCKKRCILTGEIRDKDNDCKLNNAERCQQKGECVQNANCEGIKNAKTNKKEFICRCKLTDESSISKEYFYGNTCLQKPRAFFLKLLKPLKSGKIEQDYRNMEMKSHFKLTPWEDLMTLKLGDKCDPEIEKDSLEVVKYFGNLEEVKEEEYEKMLKLVDQLVEKKLRICDHRGFLKCSTVTSTCDWMELNMIMIKNTREIRFGVGFVCNEAVEIAKIFLKDDLIEDQGQEIKDKEEKSQPFGCIDNAFCVKDYTQPSEETTDFKGDKTLKKRCRCRRGYSGLECEVKGELEEYNEKEKGKLKELIDFRLTNSVRQFKDMCFLEVEKNFPKNKEMAIATSDLYELISSLEPYLTSLDPLKAPEGLDFCDVRAHLRCVERAWHPVTKPKLIEAACDCMPGFEWVGWPWDKRPKGCYVSDGEVCQISPASSTEVSTQCASDRCEFQTDFGLYKCQEDQSFLYFKEFRSGADQRKIKLFVVTTMALVSTIYYNTID